MCFRSVIVCVLLFMIVVNSICELICKTTTNEIKLIIVHDGGADDLMAISMALLYEKYFNGPNVIGIMTSHGNVGEEQAFINTQRALTVANRRDIPIYRGSNESLSEQYPTDGFFGRDGLGETQLFNEFDPIIEQSEHASVAIVRLSKEYEGYLTVLSLGALTNIAVALLLDPNFIGRLEKLTVAAGNINSKQFPDAEFNALMDITAYHIVAKYSRPDIVTYVPFSQSSLNITKEWRINVLGSIDTKTMRALNAFEAFSLKNYNSTTWNRLDPLAVAITLDRTIINEAYVSYNDIIVCGEDRGINTNWFEVNDSNAEVLKTVDVEAYQKLLIEVFTSEIFCNF